MKKTESATEWAYRDSERDREIVMWNETGMGQAIGNLCSSQYSESLSREISSMKVFSASFFTRDELLFYMIWQINHDCVWRRTSEEKNNRKHFNISCLKSCENEHTRERSQHRKKLFVFNITLIIHLALIKANWTRNSIHNPVLSVYFLHWLQCDFFIFNWKNSTFLISSSRRLCVDLKFNHSVDVTSVFSLSIKSYSADIDKEV